MKTKTEINSGNVKIALLLAEFMEHESDRLTIIGDIENKNAAESMHYHDQWDWIMPALITIGDNTGWTLVMEENSSYWCNEGQHDDLPEFGGYNSPENIWEAMVEFSEWYAENK